MLAPTTSRSRRSETRPTPESLRSGSSVRKAPMASRVGGRRYWPLGLFMSEHTFASRREGATPTEHVRPPVAS